MGVHGVKAVILSAGVSASLAGALALLLLVLSASAAMPPEPGAVSKETVNAPPPSPNGIEQPPDYLNWRLVGISTRSDNGTMRAILGNDIAVEAARSGETNPWPDGTIFTKLVWKQVTLPEFTAAGVPGDFVQSEFMVKDSQTYPSTGGWGFARWVGLERKPYGNDASFANECFDCHMLVANRDHVFTKPALLPPGDGQDRAGGEVPGEGPK
jgi:hypothetical protein